MLRVAVSRATQRLVVNNRALSSTPSMLDIFSNLRWKAAEVLTSGLSQTEKSQLMEKLDGIEEQHQEEEEEDDTQNTIGEAVAAARMQEAQRQESKWEKEREDLLQQAEEAARARVENDLIIQERRVAAQAKWQEALEQEKKAEGGDNGVVAAKDIHPVLGPVVKDFGYKKVYQVSAKTLASIPVWKKQRVYRHDRAKVIAADKMKSLHLGLPGILVLHEDKNGKLSILDGQHRVGALALLSESAPDGFDLDNLLVEVFTSSAETKDFAEDIFVEINKSEPIKLVDMPGIAKAGDRKIITNAAAKLHEQYPDMFKPSQKCRVPHLNVDNLRDALFAAEVLKRHKLKSAAALTRWMQAQNEVLAAKYEEPDVADKVNATALKKAKKFDFFLGLESSWLYN